MMGVPEPTGPVPRTRQPEPDLSGCLRRIAAGDQQAVAELYDQSSRLIFGIVFRIVGNQQDAEELTVDVYSQVWRTAKDYSAERGSPIAWLIMIARSRALDRVRAKARAGKTAELEAAGQVSQPGQSVEASMIDSEERKRVRAAMAGLVPEQREAIELAFYSGLTHTQLAERLGQPLGTVKTRIRLGMIRLRSLLLTGGAKEVQ